MRKSKPMNTTIINNIFSGWRFKPHDHPELQILDNTMTPEQLFGLAKGASYEAEASFTKGNRSNTRELIAKLARTLAILDYHLQEEIAAEDAKTVGLPVNLRGEGATVSFTASGEIPACLEQRAPECYSNDVASR